MIPYLKRLLKGDYTEAGPWLTDLLVPLNEMFLSINTTLNKNLVIGENVQGQKFSFTFTTDAAYATGTFTPITFTYNGHGKPNCCLVGQVTESTGATLLTPVAVTNWQLNINKNPYQVVINYVAGLSANTTYTIQFVVL